MTLPQDVARLKNGTWNRRPSDAWTDPVMRGQIVAFMDTFVTAHGWTKRWDVTERFTDTGINVRVPRTQPVQPPDDPDFRQRGGLRILVMAVTRTRDKQRFEVGVSLPMGNTEPLLTILLDSVRRSLEAAHAGTP